MYDVAIIGAGPAGSSAALFTAKAGKKTVVIDSDKGMTKRAWVENHYGILETNGNDLIETGKKQAAKFGAEIVNATAQSVEREGGQFTITTDQGDFAAGKIIIATGISTDLAEKAGLKTKSGTEPRIKQVFETDEEGKTSVEGIWAAGTAAGKSVHTIITAGDGANVAINVISQLNGERYVDHDMVKS